MFPFRVINQPTTEQLLDMASVIEVVEQACQMKSSQQGENEQKGLPQLIGTVMVLDSRTGVPLGLLSGEHMTCMRTGAAGGSGPSIWLDRTERRAAPKDDLISALLAAEMDGARLNEEEVVRFCILLLVAGNESTTNLITNTIRVMTEQPICFCLTASRMPISALASAFTFAWERPSPGWKGRLPWTRFCLRCTRLRRQKQR